MWTLGSLFDGIGGFPLAAVHNGIKPVWASEVEAFPIRVTKIHFPEISRQLFDRRFAVLFTRTDVAASSSKELPSICIYPTSHAL